MATPQVGVSPEIQPEIQPKPEAITVAETTLSEETKIAAEIEPKIEAAPKAEPQPPKMAKVKVDGEEFEVPQSDIDDAGGVRAYRMERASENRLKKANDALAESRRMQAEIARVIQQMAPKQPTVTDDEFIQSKIDLIRFGTPEESAAAFKEAALRLAPAMDANNITEQAVMRMQQTIAVDNFKKQFQDIVSNPILLRAAVSLENERKALANVNTDWGTFYLTIGNEVRNATRPSQPRNETPLAGNPSQPEKEVRKASIVNLPTAAARAELPKEEKPETREEFIDRIRKKRGLPTG